MIEQPRFQPSRPTDAPRDERSMRVMELAMAILALAAAVLIAVR